MVEIDGSRGEGGGQVLRTALALSAWLGRPFRMTGIRARRTQPGLKAQHLTAVEMVARICGATVEGATLGSQTLSFHPGPLRPGTYEHEVGTAGATTLVAQAAAVPLLRALGGSRLHIGGGTHVAWSPPADYLRELYAPMLARLGLHLRVEVPHLGFYPRGGGRIEVEIQGTGSEEPAAAAPAPTDADHPAEAVWIRLERPPRHQIRIETTAVVSSLPRSIAERMAATVARVLGERHWRMRERIVEAQGPTGTYVFVRVHSHADPSDPGGAWIAGGFTGLGEPRKPAERVAHEAATEALAFLQGDASLDCRLADQVVLPALVAGVRLSFRTDRVSEHLRTQAETIAHFLGPCVHIDPDRHVEVHPPR